MNGVFSILIITSILTAAFTGKINNITVDAVTASGQGVKQVFALVGILTFGWG